MAHKVEPLAGQADGEFQEMEWEGPPFDCNAPGPNGLNDDDIKQAGGLVKAYTPAQFGPGEEFGVELDSPCCMAGTPCTGRLVIINQNPMTQIKGTMMVTVQGVALFKWIEYDKSKNKARLICSSRQESILTLPIKVKQFGSVTQLPVGVTEEKFTILLPPTALPSIRTPKHCIIFYTVQAQMQIIQPVNTQLFSTRELKVIAPYDLKHANVTLDRLDLTKQKTVGMVCCGGKLSVHVQLEKTGLVPGEKVPMHITINNDHKHQTGLQLKFWMMSINTPTSGLLLGSARIKENVLVSQQSLDFIEPFSKSTWLFNFMIPSCPAQASASLLTISYRLELQAKHTGKGLNNLKIEVPIVVGNIPKKDSYKRLKPASRGRAALTEAVINFSPDGTPSLFYNSEKEINQC